MRPFVFPSVGGNRPGAERPSLRRLPQRLHGKLLELHAT